MNRGLGWTYKLYSDPSTTAIKVQERSEEIFRSDVIYCGELGPLLQSRNDLQVLRVRREFHSENRGGRRALPSPGNAKLYQQSDPGLYEK
jgi:hypothetical protein